MLSYEFFTLQNRFTNVIYRSEVRTVQCHQETHCRASTFFQLRTQWRSNCSWAFSANNSCISETDQWLYPQLFNLPFCHIVTIKSMTTQRQKTERQVLGAVVACLFPWVALTGWWNKTSRDTFPKCTWPCGQLPRLVVCLSSLQWHTSFNKGRSIGKAAGTSGQQGTAVSSPSTHRGPNRHLIKAKPYQQFPHWCLWDCLLLIDLVLPAALELASTQDLFK